MRALAAMVLFSSANLARAQEPTPAPGADVPETGAPSEETGAPSEPVVETAPPADPPVATEQLTVYDMRVAERRQEIVKELRMLGYHEAKRGDGRTVFRHEIAWHPDVVIDDDGFLVLKRPPPQFKPPDRPGIWGSYLVCVTILPCTKVGGQVVSKRKLDSRKSEVAIETHDVVEAWRDAVVAEGMEVRLAATIPELLDRIWIDGVGPEGQSLPEKADRRKALLEFWATRSDTPQGEQARELVATYLEQMVETSDSPLQASEVQSAEAQCGCRLPFERAPVAEDPAPSVSPGGPPSP